MMLLAASPKPPGGRDGQRYNPGKGSTVRAGRCRCHRLALVSFSVSIPAGRRS
jgi:hypothetical protein